MKRQKRVEPISLPPGSLQSREGVPNKLKVVNRKDINGTLRTHVQGPNGPLPTIDVTSYHLNRGNIFVIFFCLLCAIKKSWNLVFMTFSGVIYLELCTLMSHHYVVCPCSPY